MPEDPPPAQPVLVDAASARKLLPMSDLIAAVGPALRDAGSAPDRISIVLGRRTWMIMPSGRDGGLLCKLIRVVPEGRAADGPTIAGTVVLLAPSGAVQVLIDAAALTARRTAAAAALATDLLALPNANVLALFGAGALAEPHVEAIDIVRPLKEVRVVASSPASAEALARRLNRRGWKARAATPKTALSGAQIVATLTTSPVPVFSDEDIEDGTHINAMGAYRPDRREIPALTVARARIVVETRASAWQEAGDLILARDEGMVDDESVIAELHEEALLSKVRNGESRTVTLFKSVGHVALDVAAAEVLLARLIGAEAGAFGEAGSAHSETVQ